MSSKERMRAIREGNKPDRIPIMAMGRAYCAAMGKVSLKEFYERPDLAYDLQKWVISLHGHDGSPSFGIPGWAAIDFGGELRFPNNKYGQPVPKYSIVNCVEDIEKLEIPNPRNAISIQSNLKFYEIACKNGGGVSIKAGTPLEIVSILLGVDKMLRWMVREPVSVHNLLRIATDYLKAIAKYYVDIFGAAKCSAFLPLPLESNTLISKRMFKEYAIPYINEINENMKNLGVNRFHIHLCGNHIKNLPYWTNEIKVPNRAIFSIGNEMDIHTVSEVLGEKHILAGNVPSSLLCSGTPMDVYEYTKKMVLSMKDRPGGYILMPECGVPYSTPPVNLDAMIKAGKDFGKYN